MRKLFLFSFALFFVCASTRADLVNGIYVVVNDSVITYDEVEQSIAPLVDLLATQYGNQPEVFEKKRQEVRSEQIERLVQKQLVLHEFKTAGYVLPEKVTDDTVKKQIREQFGDRATLTKTLQARGRTYEGFRKQQREDFIYGAMISQNISSEKILISPQKIETYYQEHQNDFKLGDQIKLRMIVLNKTPENTETVRKLAAEIATKLKEGASFAEMASVYSDSQKAQGGDRGWIEKSYFKSELADPAFALKPGQNSEVIDLPEACYLLRVEETRPAHVKNLVDVQAEIENTLKTQERARMQKKWIDRLRAKSFIRYF